MKVLALDIGNVCVKVDPSECFYRLGYRSAEEVPPQLYQMAGEEYERGRFGETEFLRKFRDVTGSTLPDDELRTIFNSIIREPLPGMVELIASLPAAGIRPVFFSDTSTTHLEEVKRRFPAASVVTQGVFSFEVGAKKTEDAMFEAFEARFGKPAFYTDDRMELIERAEARGWNAIRFQNAAELRRALMC